MRFTIELVKKNQVKEWVEKKDCKITFWKSSQTNGNEYPMVHAVFGGKTFFVN